MTNYEKLCEAVRIEHVYEICNKFKSCKNEPCKNCQNNVKVYPIFTAEKQIELIKLLAATESFTVDFSEIPPRNDNEQWACMCNFKSAFSADFAEALAGLTLQLIEAGELGKEAVRKVFE